MSSELVGTVVAGAVGALGIAATYLAARLQANKQIELLEHQLAEERKRELRQERRRVYGVLLSELTEIEASVDYFHRVRRGIERRTDLPELAAEAATEMVGEVDHVAHFKKLHDLAAQASLVCTNALHGPLHAAVSDAMRAMASMLGRRDGDEVARARESREALMSVMLYELRLSGYDKPYEDLLEEFRKQAAAAPSDEPTPPVT